MMPIESFRRYRKIDLIAILVLAILWAIITSIVNIPNNQLSFMFVLFITTMFMAFTAFFIRKIGAVSLFYLLGAIITIPFNNLGGLGLYKIPILLMVGIIFELFFLLLKIEIKNIPLDVILGAAFSMASIPWIMFLLLVTEQTKNIMPSVWNFALTAFIIGVMGATVMFLIWYNIKGLKPIIKFEYSV